MPSQTATMLSSSLVPMSASTSGMSLLDIAAIALHQAAGDNQLLRAADPLVLRHFQDRVDGFLLGGIDETTGVDDQDFGLIGMRW